MLFSVKLFKMPLARIIFLSATINGEQQVEGPPSFQRSRTATARGREVSCERSWFYFSLLCIKKLRWGGSGHLGKIILLASTVFCGPWRSLCPFACPPSAARHHQQLRAGKQG